MAYFTKANRRYSRRRYYKRRFKRGRYFYRRRKGYRRYHRKTKLAEYKRIEFAAHEEFMAQSKNVTYGGETKVGFVVLPSFHTFTTIGSSRAGVTIPQGYLNAQRIGNKINPYKLRVWGTLALTPSFDNNGQPLTNPNLTACQVRVIVMQVRAGNTEWDPANINFTDWNPYVEIYSPNNQTQSYVSPQFMNRILSQYPQVKFWVPNAQTGIREQFVWGTEYAEYTATSKSPYRMGLASYVRILKSKTYTLQSGYKTTLPIRFKCKKPSRMIWCEHKTADNTTEENCRNPIYIVAIPLFLGSFPNARLEVNFNVDMSYTDI